ncbi:MAG: hypothetical protein RIF32_05020 [Leptospirales bacterium]
MTFKLNLVKALACLLSIFTLGASCTISRNVKPEQFDGTRKESLGAKMDLFSGPHSQLLRGNIRYTAKNGNVYYTLRVRLANLTDSAQSWEPLQVRMEKHERTAKNEKTGEIISVPNMPSNVHYCKGDHFGHEFVDLFANLKYIFAPLAFEKTTLEPGETQCREYTFLFPGEKQPTSLVIFDIQDQKSESGSRPIQDLVTIDLVDAPRTE